MPRVAALLAAVAVLAGCGEKKETTTAATTAAAAPSPAPRGPVPAAVSSVESSAEDTIDFALAGQRAKAVATARRLRTAADGPAGAELRKAGVSSAQVADFRKRATAVARLAPKADLLQVALASNHAFEMVPGFFAHYRTTVPAVVQTLDYLDFEAKLRAKVGDAAKLRGAASGLDHTWSELKPAVVAHGGAAAARRFDAHVRRLRALGPGAAAVREAQHGLDLVDQVEEVYER